jgi:hypothetical protein
VAVEVIGEASELVDVEADAGLVHPQERPVGAHPPPPERGAQGREGAAQAGPRPFRVGVGPEQFHEAVAGVHATLHREVDEKSDRLAGVDVERIAIDAHLWVSEHGECEHGVGEYPLRHRDIAQLVTVP